MVVAFLVVDVFVFVELTEGLFATFSEAVFGVAALRVDFPFAAVSFTRLFVAFVLVVSAVSLVEL